jgi:hypothetical protein
MRLLYQAGVELRTPCNLVEFLVDLPHEVVWKTGVVELFGELLALVDCPAKESGQGLALAGGLLAWDYGTIMGQTIMGHT